MTRRFPAPHSAGSLRSCRIAPGDAVEPSDRVRTPRVYIKAASIKKPGRLRSGFNNGGERGIRTLDTLSTYTPLAGVRLQPLGQLS